MRYHAVLLAMCTLLLAESFPPAEVAILGDIDYGRQSEALECPVGKQKFCALVFNGESGHEVEVTVTGGNTKPFVAIADGSLTELARGTGRAVVKLSRVAMVARLPPVLGCPVLSEPLCADLTAS